MSRKDPPQKKAIVVGCSTGIGRALAKKLSAEGYFVALTGRSLEKLQELQKELPGKSLARVVDLRNASEAIHSLRNVIMGMWDLDLMVINAGVLFRNEKLQWSFEEEMIQVNALGFAAAANVAADYFQKKGSGCIVGISSVAAHRGSGRSPAYNASKAFVSNYMEGLRRKFSNTAVQVIDIRPGFVDTDMVRGRKGLFGVISPEKAAEDIFEAIQKGKKVAYVPFWWKPLMGLVSRVPEWVYHLGYRRHLAWDNAPPKA
ncbi:MAG: SDR family NAD(P)-dependent oxidoreductase [Candidatus Omnitrophota bacterium]